MKLELISTLKTPPAPSEVYDAAVERCGEFGNTNCLGWGFTRNKDNSINLIRYSTRYALLRPDSYTLFAYYGARLGDDNGMPNPGGLDFSPMSGGKSSKNGKLVTFLFCGTPIKVPEGGVVHVNSKNQVLRTELLDRKTDRKKSIAALNKWREKMKVLVATARLMPTNNRTWNNDREVFEALKAETPDYASVVSWRHLYIWDGGRDYVVVSGERAQSITDRFISRMRHEINKHENVFADGG